MRVLVDTGVLLCGCLLLALIVGQVGTATVIWLIAAVTIAGLSMSTDQRQWGIAAPAAYLLVGALSTDSVTGAPLVVYVLARLGALTTRRARMTAVAACIPFVAAVAARVQDTPVLALALVFCALAALLALRTVQEEAARRSLHVVRDDLREKVLTLQDTNAQLLQAQDYELRAAALAERTRIAREIHDGVGHLLTRLLLQVKALQDLPDNPGLVYLTIGGNDIGFKDIVQGCIGGNCTVNRAEMTRRLSDIPQRKESLKKTYRAVMKAANTRDRVKKRHGKVAPLIVSPYPDPLWEAEQGNCATVVPVLKAFSLSPSEISYGRQILTLLNRTVRDAVTELSKEGYPVYYAQDVVDLAKPNHTMCNDDSYFVKIGTLCRFHEAELRGCHARDAAKLTA